MIVLAIGVIIFGCWGLWQVFKDSVDGEMYDD